MEEQQQTQTQEPKKVKPIWKKWWFWVITIFIFFVVISIEWSGRDVEKQVEEGITVEKEIVEEPIEEPTEEEIAEEIVDKKPVEEGITVEKETSERFTVLSGIERDPESDAYGELVVSEINLWENPGPDRGKVVGKVKHNTKVQILDEKETDQLYYLVKSNDLIGWVSELFFTP
ncbi:unnamed protein product [marine sediment metagenome]|uniref:SH3b domain-containing protein n=1 Tax=marine sediment metagenome TaxID=412755 RepID=X1N2S3_9ZZZZ